MKKYNKSTTNPALLRQKAEDLLNKKPLKPGSPLSEFEALKLVHELEVHQIELKMQTEELLLAKANAAELAAEKYAELFDMSPSGYFTLSREGEIIELNLCGSQVLGKERSSLINCRFGFFVSDDTRPEFNLFLEHAFRNKSIETCEVTLATNDNSQKHVHLSGIADETKELCFVTAIDVTERKRAEAALTASEEHFHSLFDNMAEGVALHELVFENGKPVNYRIVNVNNPFLKIIGVSREQVVGKLATEAYGTTIPPYFEEYTEVALSKNPIGFETYFALLDKHISISVAPWQGHGFATIFSDITDRKRAEEEINLKNEELQKLNAEKDKFFSIIAHDLRSPFSSFLGLTEIMVAELSEHEQTDLQEMAEMMQKSASNLYSLLNNLLEWSQIQQGSISFNPAPIQLRSIADESLSLVFETAKTKGIEMVCDIPENIVVFADSHFLQTIIRNLVSNALKFTPKGGKVSLSAKSEDGQNIKISVSDTGIGMSKVMINNLFRPDVKTNRLGTNNEPSTGLGLLLCKEFIEKHDGEFWVESAEGKGSVFNFTLPYCAEYEEDNIIKDEISTNLEENQMRKIKLLIAEDDEASGMLLERITENYCEKILKAKTGVEAVEICRNNPDLDLVLMDIKMPDMDGFEATRQIRKFNPGVIIIAQTAFVLADDSVKTIETGCTDFIAKPIQRKQLMEVINMYF